MQISTSSFLFYLFYGHEAEERIIPSWQINSTVVNLREKKLLTEKVVLPSIMEAH